ncbi:MAG: hypothetical protein RIR01_2086 [Bacteroidota bacterium]|jgi:hypothetical protein
MEKGEIKDFFTSKGHFSHTRLISIIGSFIVFGVFIAHPLDGGLQNIMFGILAASMTNATISKFSRIENGNRGKRVKSDQEI